MSIDRIPLPRTDGALWLTSRNEIAPDPDAVLQWADHATTVVCLNPVGELEHRYPTYVEWLRRHLGAAAIWYPIGDFGAPSAAAARPVIRMITDRLEAGEGVVMHCALGQGRAGTMAACVLIALGLEADEAVRTVASNRAMAGPAGAGQWRLVDEFASLIKHE